MSLFDLLDIYTLLRTQQERRVNDFNGILCGATRDGFALDERRRLAPAARFANLREWRAKTISIKYALG